MGRARLCELIGDSHSGCLLIEAASSSPRLVPVNPVFILSRRVSCSRVHLSRLPLEGSVGHVPRVPKPGGSSWCVSARLQPCYTAHSIDQKGGGGTSAAPIGSLSLVLLTVVRLKVKKIGEWKGGGNKDNAHRTIYKRAAT